MDNLEFRTATVKFACVVDIDNEQYSGEKNGLDVALADGWLYLDKGRDTDGAHVIYALPGRVVTWVRYSPQRP